MTLIELRKLKTNKSQKQMGELLGITEKTFNKYENRPKHMPIGYLIPMAKEYNVTPFTAFKAALRTYKGGN